MARDIANKFNDAMAKLKPMDKLKAAVEKFFEVTDDPIFRALFLEVASKISKLVGMTREETDWAMNLIKREFW